MRLGATQAQVVGVEYMDAQRRVVIPEHRGLSHGWRVRPPRPHKIRSTLAPLQLDIRLLLETLILRLVQLHPLLVKLPLPLFELSLFLMPDLLERLLPVLGRPSMSWAAGTRIHAAKSLDIVFGEGKLDGDGGG